MIEIKTFTFNPFQENTYILYDETKECIVIDPGCYEPDEKAELRDFIDGENLKVTKLINTHCHIDHVLGNCFVKELYKVPLIIHNKDESTLRSVKVYAPSYGFVNYEDCEADEYIEEGDKINFGSSSLEVLFVPGHAPGHIALVSKEQKVIIGGDVLFHRSVGRTDLPGGDFDTLMNSIHDKLFPLGDDFTIYPGHGAPTNLGDEKKENPFCSVKR